MSEIYNTAEQSFLSGRSFVTTTVKTFEPSDPFHHGAELTSTIHSHYWRDDASLDKEILPMFTHSSGDNNVMRIPTQISLIYLFIKQNFDK